MSVQTFRKSAFAVVAAGLILAGGVWAGRMAAGPLTGDHRLSVQKMFNRIADRLDLSDSQRDQVKGVLRSHRDAILAQAQAARKARQDLHEAMSASPFDEGSIRARAAVLGQVEGDGAVLHALIRAEILPILNDDQRQNLESFDKTMRRPGNRMASSLNEFLSAPGTAR